MKKFLKRLKWLFILVFTILIFSILYIRFTRMTDKIMYQTNDDYEVFESRFNHEELFIPIEKDIKIHTVLLLKPE